MSVPTSDLEMLDDNEEITLESKVVVIHFDLSKVCAFYEVLDGDERYLYCNVEGIEYPFVYEDFLLEALLERFGNDDETEISA